MSNSLQSTVLCHEQKFKKKWQINNLQLSQVFLEVHTTSPLEMRSKNDYQQFLPFLEQLSFIFSRYIITWMYFASNGFKQFTKCIYINIQFNPFSHRIPMVP